MLFGWVGRIIVGARSPRPYNWQRTPLDIPILLFLGLGLIASLLAPHPATSSLGYFWKHLRAILLFYAVIHCRLGTRWRHVVIVFIAAAGISSALGLWYYANDTRLGIDFMGRIGLQFQEELTAGDRFSEELRAELRSCNVPLSETASFVPSKQPNEWRIDDPARDRRYAVRKSETHLMVYMIEQRLTGTFKMPNDLGAYLALTLPFVMGYFVVGCSGLAWVGTRPAPTPERTGSTSKITTRLNLGNHRTRCDFSTDECQSGIDTDARSMGERRRCRRLYRMLFCSKDFTHIHAVETKSAGIGLSRCCILRVDREYRFPSGDNWDRSSTYQGAPPNNDFAPRGVHE